MKTTPANPTVPAEAPTLRPRKIRLPHLTEMKRAGERIAMATAYDYPTAMLADQAGMEIVLVGDSLGNVVLGLESTLEVSMEVMIHHTRAVRRGLRRALLVADMPFMSYQISAERAVENAGRLVSEGGAEAVKLEGAGEHLEAVRRIAGAGVPVMGHLGFTPQAVNALGGYRVQAREEEDADRLVRDAQALEAAGAFAIVLELMTSEAARRVREAVEIPVIGIGAGADCDGQVLVWHDALGLRPDAPPRFCRPFANLWQNALDGLRAYWGEVKGGTFPGPENEYE